MNSNKKMNSDNEVVKKNHEENRSRGIATASADRHDWSQPHHTEKKKKKNKRNKVTKGKEKNKKNKQNGDKKNKIKKISCNNSAFNTNSKENFRNSNNLENGKRRKRKGLKINSRSKGKNAKRCVRIRTGKQLEKVDPKRALIGRPLTGLREGRQGTVKPAPPKL